MCFYLCKTQIYWKTCPRPLAGRVECGKGVSLLSVKYHSAQGSLKSLSFHSIRSRTTEWSKFEFALTNRIWSQFSGRGAQCPLAKRFGRGGIVQFGSRSNCARRLFVRPASVSIFFYGLSYGFTLVDDVPMAIDEVVRTGGKCFL